MGNTHFFSCSNACYKQAAPENPKKVRFETKEDELEPVNEFPADEDMYAEYDDTMYPENNYETYDYEEAGGFYEYWLFLVKGLPEALSTYVICDIFWI